MFRYIFSLFSKYFVISFVVLILYFVLKLPLVLLSIIGLFFYFMLLFFSSLQHVSIFRLDFTFVPHFELSFFLQIFRYQVFVFLENPLKPGRLFVAVWYFSRFFFYILALFSIFFRYLAAVVTISFLGFYIFLLAVFIRFVRVVLLSYW